MTMEGGLGASLRGGPSQRDQEKEVLSLYARMGP